MPAATEITGQIEYEYPLLGPPGTGKTHLATGVGLRATQLCHRYCSRPPCGKYIQVVLVGCKNIQHGSAGHCPTKKDASTLSTDASLSRPGSRANATRDPRITEPV
jgi:hypothetical protein